MIPVHIFMTLWIIGFGYGLIRAKQKRAKCEPQSKEFKLDIRITSMGLIFGILVYIFAILVTYTDWIYK